MADLRILEDLPASRTEPDGSAVVRLLSYNVRSLRDDRNALVRVIRACAPDIVCVQEAPRFFRWRKKANWLARDCGLVTVTGGATAAGPLLMSSLRARVIRFEDVLLPRTPGLHQRGFATAVLGFGGVRLAVASFHLSLNADERHDQAGTLLRRYAAGAPADDEVWAPAASGAAGSAEQRTAEQRTAHTAAAKSVDGAPQAYTVIAGDVNEQPGGRTWQRLADGLRDAHTAAPWGSEFTSDSRDPHQRIDAIFVSPGVEVLGCGVPEGLPGITAKDLAVATDHRPVLAALRLPAVSTTTAASGPAAPLAN